MDRFLRHFQFYRMNEIMAFKIRIRLEDEKTV